AAARAQTTIAMVSAWRTFIRLEIAIRLSLLFLLRTNTSIGELYLKWMNCGLRECKDGGRITHPQSSRVWPSENHRRVYRRPGGASTTVSSRRRRRRPGPAGRTWRARAEPAELSSRALGGIDGRRRTARR